MVSLQSAGEKSVFACQPFATGPKEKKSLVILIPARVVRECDITTSTIFALTMDRQSKKVVFESLPLPENGQSIPQLEEESVS